MDRELLRSELAVHGIRVDLNNDTVHYFRASEEEQGSAQNIISKIKQDMRSSGQILNNLWDELVGALTMLPISYVEGSEATQRMFIHSVKQLWRLIIVHEELSDAKPLLRKILNRDIRQFTEKFMSRIIEYTLCMNWMQRVVRYDRYRIYLLEQFAPEQKVAYTNYDFGNPGAGGSVDVPMSDRVYSYDEWEKDNEEEKQSPTWKGWKRRYFAHLDEDWQDGFYTEDTMHRLTNSPYLYTDEDENNKKKTNLSLQA